MEIQITLLQLAQFIGVIVTATSPIFMVIWKISNKISRMSSDINSLKKELAENSKKVSEYNANVLSRVERISLRLDDTGRVTGENKNEIVRIGTRVSDIKEEMRRQPI